MLKTMKSTAAGHSVALQTGAGRESEAKRGIASAQKRNTISPFFLSIFLGLAILIPTTRGKASSLTSIASKKVKTSIAHGMQRKNVKDAISSPRRLKVISPTRGRLARQMQSAASQRTRFENFMPASKRPAAKRKAHPFEEKKKGAKASSMFFSVRKKKRVKRGEGGGGGGTTCTTAKAIRLRDREDRLSFSLISSMRGTWPYDQSDFDAVVTRNQYI